MCISISGIGILESAWMVDKEEINAMKYIYIINLFVKMTIIQLYNSQEAESSHLRKLG